PATEPSLPFRRRQLFERPAVRGLLAFAAVRSPRKGREPLWLDLAVAIEADTILANGQAGERRPHLYQQSRVEIQFRNRDLALAGKLDLVDAVGRLLDRDALTVSQSAQQLHLLAAERGPQPVQFGLSGDRHYSFTFSRPLFSSM